MQLLQPHMLRVGRQAAASERVLWPCLRVCPFISLPLCADDMPLRLPALLGPGVAAQMSHAETKRRGKPSVPNVKKATSSGRTTGPSSHPRRDQRCVQGCIILPCLVLAKLASWRPA